MLLCRKAQGKCGKNKHRHWICRRLKNKRTPLTPAGRSPAFDQTIIRVATPSFDDLLFLNPPCTCLSSSSSRQRRVLCASGATFIFAFGVQRTSNHFPRSIQSDCSLFSMREIVHIQTGQVSTQHSVGTPFYLHVFSTTVR